jgi:hypothetical protein
LEYTASGGVILILTCPLRGIDNAPLLFLGRARAVFRAALFAILDPAAVQCSPDYVITNAGEVFDASAAHQNDRVFLKIMPHPGDVSRDLNTVGETYASDLAESRVGLLWGNRVNACTNASALRVLLQCRRREARPLVGSAMPYELRYAWQIFPSFIVKKFFGNDSTSRRKTHQSFRQNILLPAEKRKGHHISATLFCQEKSRFVFFRRRTTVSKMPVYSLSRCPLGRGYICPSITSAVKKFFVDNEPPLVNFPCQEP